MAERGEFGSYGAQRAPLAGLRRLAGQPAGLYDNGSGNGPTPFAPPRSGTLCLACMAQLRNKGGLLELGDSTEDLADELGGRAGVGEVAWRVGRHQFDAALS